MREDSPIIRQLLHGWQQPGWLNRITLPLSFLYSGVMRMRRSAANYGFMRVTRLPVPVIVVGNLSVGGTGKSPLVIALAEFLKSSGWRPGIVTRGYGGSHQGDAFVIGVDHDVAVTGDEPMMLASRNVAPVAVGRERVAAARLLIAEHDCDVIVSDDGFQHLALGRDINIVVIDGERGFGNGWCLPSGPLRESRSALSAADMLVINGGESGDFETGLPTKPTFDMRMRADSLSPLMTPSATVSLADFAGTHANVTAMAGIGNPQRFFESLVRAGIDVDPRPKPDHHPFSRRDFAELARDEVIVITAKDAVKCSTLVDAGEIDPQIAARIWVMAAVAELESGFYDAMKTMLPASY